jgi:hypothetical protein
MARTKLNDGQLEKLVNADKVSGAALNLTGSDVSALTTLTGGDHFLVQSGSAVPKKITADSMQDFFSKVDIAETSANSSYQILFVNDDTGFVEASFSAFQTSRMQESTVTNSTSALTFSPEYGTSSSSGDIIRFKDSGGNEIAFTVSSSVTSSATSVSVAYHSGASNATSMSKSSISSVVTLTAGSGDGVLRVDGSHLNYNPSSNLLTIGGDISVGDDILMTSDGAVLSLGDGADVTLTHDGSNGAAIAAAGAFDIDAGGALTLDGSSITIGGDSDVAVDFDSSTFDLDASGALTMDSAAAVTITGATGASLNDDTEGLAYDGSGNVDFDAVALDIDASGAITIDGATTLSLDAADDSNLTVTASGKDLDIAVAGGSTQELRLASAGTGASALHLNASVGGVDIDSADMITLDAADEITLTTTSADGHISLVTAHTAGVAFHIDANANASSEVQIDAGILDVDVTGAATVDAGGSITLTGAGVLLAGGSSEIDITTSGDFDVNVGSVDLDSTAGIAIDATTLSIDGTDDSNITVTASAKDLDIAVAGGGDQELRLASAGTGASALHLNASAGGVDIDSADMITLDAADEITLTTTSADGHISLVTAHTAGVAFHIDANANASSEVQIDAGILDVDVTGAATIDAGGAMTLTAAGIALAGGSSEVDITTSGALDLNSGAMTLDASTISLDGSGALNIDTSDTSNGIALGTATSGVPISIGHSTSLVTVNDNLTVTGDLIVNGDTVTVSTANLLVEDPIVVLNKANASANGQGGIAIELGGSSSDMVIGRVANDTWGVGTKDTSGGTVTTLADMTLGALRAGKLEIDGASDHIDVSTDMIITAAADVQFAPGGGNVLPSTDSTVSLGKAAALGSAASFSAFQTNRLQESSLTSSTTSFTFSPEFGTTVSAGDVVIFTDSSSNTLAFAFSSAVGSSATNVTVAYSSGNSNATSMSKSAISSVTKRAMASGAWATLYVDNIDLDGQGRIDLDDDQDTSIRASADDVITFEAGGADEMSMSTTALYPATDDGLALGSANQNWSDLFLADEAVLSFGDDQDVTLTHVADTGILMSSTDQFQFGDSGTYIHQAADGQLDIVSDGNIDLAVGAAGVIVRGTTPKVTIGDAGAEDTFLVFDGNAQDYRIGLDDGTDVLEFGVGATHGTTTSLKMDASLNVDVAGHNGSSVGLKLGGTIVAATATELSVMDGDTSATSTTVATGDRVVFNDAGTMKQVSVDQVGQYYGGGAGIQASSAGVLSITCVADIATSVTKGSILTSDLKTGSLSQNMVSGSLQVFLNGMLQTQSGSVEGTPDGGSQGAIYDYHLLTTTGPPKVRFEEALDGDDVLQLRYIKA